MTAPSFDTKNAMAAATVVPIRRRQPRNNQDAAEVLFNIATILEQLEDNPYRIRAYRNAARLLLRSSEDINGHLVSGKKGQELNLPGLCDRLRRKLGELLSSGRMGFYVELVADLPVDVRRLLVIPGVGPKTALRLSQDLGLTTAKDVRDAARSGQIRRLHGFGPRRERQLLQGAEHVLAGNPKRFTPFPVDEDETPPTPPTPMMARQRPPRTRQLDLLEAA